MKRMTNSISSKKKDVEAYRIDANFIPTSKSTHSAHEVHTIDGSMLEGGGQILRMSMALAAATGKAVRIVNIRAKRERPGLQPQHLTGVELVCTMCSGHLEGNCAKSMELLFVPGELTGGAFYASPGTAGATTLLVQVGESSIRFVGGTDNPLAPPVDYLVHVLAPTLRRLFHIDLRLQAALVVVVVVVAEDDDGEEEGEEEVEQVVKRGAVVKVHCRAFVSGNLPRHIPKLLLQHAVVPVRHYFRAHPEPSESLLRGGSPASEGQPQPQITSEVLQESDDGADQLVVFMAMAAGTSRVLISEPTLHTRTAIQVAELLTSARFSLLPYRGMPPGVRSPLEGERPAAAHDVNLPAGQAAAPRHNEQEIPGGTQERPASAHSVPGGVQGGVTSSHEVQGRMGDDMASIHGVPRHRGVPGGTCGSPTGGLSTAHSEKKASAEPRSESEPGGKEAEVNSTLTHQCWVLECEGAGLGPVAILESGVKIEAS
eukprot:jgi/Mesen1/4955/ME000247S04230